MRHRCERGFTLIEMMIVILIIGILAAIAIFAIRPFQQAAVETCFDTELTLAEVIEAARKAGITASIPEGDECVPIVLVLGAAVENPNSVVTLSSQPQQGHTMVAISAHRSTAASPGPTPVICSGAEYQPNNTCSASTGGWQLAGYQNVGTGSTGRGIAVWTKSVGANESTTIRAAWVDPVWGQSKSLLVGVFNRELTVTDIGFNNSGTGGTVSNLTLGTASGNSGPAVIVGSLAARHPSSGDGPCLSSTPSPYHCVQFSGVNGITKVSHGQPSSVFNMMAWTAVRNGQGPHTVAADWERPLHASGFTVVLSLFP